MCVRRSDFAQPLENLSAPILITQYLYSYKTLLHIHKLFFLQFHNHFTSSKYLTVIWFNTDTANVRLPLLAKVLNLAEINLLVCSFMLWQTFTVVRKGGGYFNKYTIRFSPQPKQYYCNILQECRMQLIFLLRFYWFRLSICVCLYYSCCQFVPLLVYFMITVSSVTVVTLPKFHSSVSTAKIPGWSVCTTAASGRRNGMAEEV